MFRFSLVPDVSSRILRFLLVGGMGTAFSYGVYALLLMAGVHYAPANFMALCAGILFSFKTQGTFVFDNSDNSLLGRFVAVWLVIYVANVLFIREMLVLGLDVYSAGALAVPAIAIISYVGQRYVVFRTSGTTGGYRSR